MPRDSSAGKVGCCDESERRDGRCLDEQQLWRAVDTRRVIAWQPSTQGKFPQRPQPAWIRAASSVTRASVAVLSGEPGPFPVGFALTGMTLVR